MPALTVNANATVALRRLSLLFVALLLPACSSVPHGTDWKGQRRYGTYMARRGYWREALFRYEKAAALKPDDARTQNDLAVACESLGETARALDAYKKALALQPGDSYIKRNYARFAEYYTSVQRTSAPAAVPSPTPVLAPAATPVPAAPPAVPPPPSSAPGSSPPSVPSSPPAAPAVTPVPAGGNS